MDLGNSGYYVAALAAAGAIGASWGYVKSFFSSMMGLVVVTLHVRNNAVLAMNAYCFHKLSRKFMGSKSYDSSYHYVKAREKFLDIPFEFINASMTFWKGSFPLVISSSEKKGKSDGPSSDSESPIGHRELTLRFIRGTFDSDGLIKEAFDYYNQIQNGNEYPRYYVYHIVGNDAKELTSSRSGEPENNGGPVGHASLAYRPIGYQLTELGPDIAVNSFSNLVYTQSIHDAIREARFWKNSRNWYKQRGLPWKRGWNIRGAPGTGKTSLVRALGQDLNMPIYVFHLASLSNNEFKKGYQQALQNTPCICLYEDADTVFKGRKNVSGGKLNFDMLLNCIDGVQESEGVFTIITTNNIDDIDPALGGGAEGGSIGARPGRVDRLLELVSIDFDGALALCQRIVPEYPDTWEGMIKKALDDKDTPAIFQERCSRLAIIKRFTDIDNEIKAAAMKT